MEELKNAKYNEKLVFSECQSGFDGRILTQDLAIRIKEARFINPRIAWDNSYDDYEDIEKQIRLLINAGYKPKEIYIFMVYNFKIPFEIMEAKRKKCYEWGVQIADCRYRPLNQTFDNYIPSKNNQTNKEYFIHSIWEDKQVKLFRANIRKQNICIRHDFPFYSKLLEHKSSKNLPIKKIKELVNINEKINLLKKHNIDYWLPNNNE